MFWFTDRFSATMHLGVTGKPLSFTAKLCKKHFSRSLKRSRVWEALIDLADLWRNSPLVHASARKDALLLQPLQTKRSPWDQNGQLLCENLLRSITCIKALNSQARFDNKSYEEDLLASVWSPDGNPSSLGCLPKVFLTFWQPLHRLTLHVTSNASLLSFERRNFVNIWLI